MSRPFEIEFKIGTNTEYLKIVRNLAKQIFSESFLDSIVANRSIVALDEAFSNIARHGHDNNGRGVVTVKIQILSEKIVITLIDNGKPFNPELLKSKPLDWHKYIKRRKAGGLGFFMIKKIMDELKYQRSENGENILIMIKYLSNQKRCRN